MSLRTRCKWGVVFHREVTVWFPLRDSNPRPQDWEYGQATYLRLPPLVHPYKVAIFLPTSLARMIPVWMGVDTS